MNNKQLTIAFHVYTFSFRGTERALFDYADKNEELLNNKSIIVCSSKFNEINNIGVIMKFMNRFKMFLYDDYNHLVEILHKEKVNGMYFINYGHRDELSNYFEFNKINIPLLIHCAYMVDQKHGFVYAGASKAVVKDNPSIPYVPHMITFNPNGPIIDYRKDKNIPDTAIVFGRNGGMDTFNNVPNDISVKDVILKVLDNNQNIHFAFMPCPYILMDVKHPRIHYFDNDGWDSVKQRSFMNMCDAMLHSSFMGETFGISILEFSVMNKPIITWNGGTFKQHIDNLGKKGILYNNMKELYDILVKFKKENYDKGKDYWNVALPKYSDINVMKDFDRVFLDPLKVC